MTGRSPRRDDRFVNGSEEDMTKVLIGVDGSDRSEDAVSFGRALALAAGAPVVLATVHQPEPSQPRLGGHLAHPGLWEEAESLLARFALMLLDVEDVERRPLADHSPARALKAAAETAGAGIIVVGSSHVGRFGRVLPGSTAERLLHGAPCPVAVVPVGFGGHGLPEHPVIGCGHLATDDGDAAIGAAEELAHALGGSLQVTHVVEPPSLLYDSGEVPLNLPELDARIRAEAERAMAERVGHLSARLRHVEGTVQVGRPADQLIGWTEAVDVMVVGSRGYGPLRAVLLGGVSGRLIRSAAGPVVVVPRGTHTTVGSLFGPSAVASAG
jgi:nucleotide-binding universal stress UspA family protein